MASSLAATTTHMQEWVTIEVDIRGRGMFSPIGRKTGSKPSDECLAAKSSRNPGGMGTLALRALEEIAGGIPKGPRLLPVGEMRGEGREVEEEEGLDCHWCLASMLSRRMSDPLASSSLGCEYEFESEMSGCMAHAHLMTQPT